MTLAKSHLKPPKWEGFKEMQTRGRGECRTDNATAFLLLKVNNLTYEIRRQPDTDSLWGPLRYLKINYLPANSHFSKQVQLVLTEQIYWIKVKKQEMQPASWKEKNGWIGQEICFTDMWSPCFWGSKNKTRRIHPTVAGSDYESTDLISFICWFKKGE